MPFTSKHPNIGKTEKIRIPSICVPHIENLLEHYDRICGAHDEEFLYKIQLKIEEGLENIQSHVGHIDYNHQSLSFFIFFIPNYFRAGRVL